VWSKMILVLFRLYLVPAHKLPLRRGTDPASLATAATDDTLMHGCLNTVVHLQVELRKLVFLVSRRILDITKR